jgi:hypothetical protein
MAKEKKQNFFVRLFGAEKLVVLRKLLGVIIRLPPYLRLKGGSSEPQKRKISFFSPPIPRVQTYVPAGSEIVKSTTDF